MINKQLKEIKDKLDTVIKLMQDNEYLDKLDKGLDYQNKEIKRLNNIIKRYDDYLLEELEYLGYDPDFIKKRIIQLKGESNEVK